MRRREVLAGLAAAAGPLGAEAQQPTMPRIELLNGPSRAQSEYSRAEPGPSSRVAPAPSLFVSQAPRGLGDGRGSRVGTAHSDMIWCTSITLPSGSWKKIWCHPFIAHVP
jgi:hypothetical protein